MVAPRLLPPLLTLVLTLGCGETLRVLAAPADDTASRLAESDRASPFRPLPATAEHARAAGALDSQNRAIGSIEGDDSVTALTLRRMLEIEDDQARTLRDIDKWLEAHPNQSDAARQRSQPGPIWIPANVLAPPVVLDANDQVNPATPLLDQYTESNIEATAAIITVPDPRVPRLLRQYEEAITAIDGAMLRDGYVLDRYFVPWRRELDRRITPWTSSGDGNSPPPVHDRNDKIDLNGIEDDSRYGLLLYRKDGWRDPTHLGASNALVRLRALYVVPETGTYGVPRGALWCALRNIDRQMDERKAFVSRRTAQSGPLNPYDDRTYCPFEDGGALQPSEGSGTRRSPARGPTAVSPLAVIARLKNGHIPLEGFIGPFCGGPDGDTRLDGVEIIGPTFSGSLDSIRETLNAVPRRPLLRHIRDICLVSPSATAYTNVLSASANPGMSFPHGRNRASDEGSPEVPRTTKDTRGLLCRATEPRGMPHRRYCALSASDAARLEALSAWLTAIHVDVHRVALLYEDTVYGDEVCPERGSWAYSQMQPGKLSDVPTLCDSALKIAFPVSVADVRYGILSEQAERQKESETAMAKGTLAPPTSDFMPPHLPLAEGAENGSEFPESDQSPVTTAASELTLERLTDTVMRLAPQVVVIVATDVRDRLFLMQLLTSAGSRALFVDLNADALSAHRAFMYTSRGMLALSSTVLTRRWYSKQGGDTPARLSPAGNWPQRSLSLAASTPPTGTMPSALDVWSTEEQAEIYDAVQAWNGQPASLNRTPDGIRAARAASPGGDVEGIVPLVVTRSGLLSAADLAHGGSMASATLAFATIVALVVSVGLFALGSQSSWRLPGGRPDVSFEGVVLGVIPAAAVAAGAASATDSSGCQLAAVMAIGLGGMLLAAFTRWSWLSAGVATLGMTTVTACVVRSWRVLATAHSSDVGFANLLSALGGNPKTGMAYTWAVAAVIAAAACSIWIAARTAAAHSRTDTALNGALPRAALEELRWARASWGEIAVWGGAAAGLAIAAIVFRQGHGWHVTVFGWWPDLTMYIGLTLVIALELIMLIGARHASRRTLELAKVAGVMRAQAGRFYPTSPEQQPLLWARVQVVDPPSWPATPALASAARAPVWVRSFLAPAGTARYAPSVASALTGTLDSNGLGALYAMLADEMTAYRRAILGMVACAAAGGAIVYLFPVSEATVLISLDAGILLVGGFNSAFQILQFESNRVLSNVICNRPQKRKWSARLIAMVLLPFIVLAGLVSIAQLPGVLDAEGGMIQLLVDRLPIWKR